MASQANVRSVDNAIEAANNSYARKTVSTKGKNDVSKYNIDNFSYPKDLMDPAGIYGGNYVVFYINIPVDSKLGRSTSTETVADYTPGERGYTVGANMTQGDIRGGQAALSVGGAILGKTLGVGGAGAVAAAGAVGGTEVTIRNAATTNRGQKRLKTAIALHIPNQLAARYGVQWAEEDTFAFSAAVAGADQLNELKKLTNIEVITITEDPDSDKTKMKQAATKGIYENFKKKLPSTIRELDGRRLMNDMRAGLGLEAVKEQIVLVKDTLPS